jgi:hypothetical protein
MCLAMRVIFWTKHRLMLLFWWFYVIPVATLPPFWWLTAVEDGDGNHIFQP